MIEESRWAEQLRKKHEAIIKCAQANPELTAQVLATRFGVSAALVKRVLANAGISLQKVRTAWRNL